MAEAQIIFFKESVALEVAAMELRDVVRNGDILNHPDISHPQSVSYTKGSAITNKDRFSANEQLTITTARVVPFYVNHCVLAWKQALNNLAISGKLLIKRTIPTEADILCLAR